VQDVKLRAFLMQFCEMLRKKMGMAGGRIGRGWVRACDDGMETGGWSRSHSGSFGVEMRKERQKDAHKDGRIPSDCKFAWP
jgi:hypothetical protein